MSKIISEYPDYSDIRWTLYLAGRGQAGRGVTSNDRMDNNASFSIGSAVNLNPQPVHAKNQFSRCANANRPVDLHCCMQAWLL